MLYVVLKKPTATVTFIFTLFLKGLILYICARNRFFISAHLTISVVTQLVKI